jgi:dTMP kinase
VSDKPAPFITFEGGEAAGKSTQIARLADRLRHAGHDIVITREPGGSPGAEAIRALMLDPATDLTPLADTLLVFAARADHAAKLIIPALRTGKIVLCDRFIDSTLAYQGYGLGMEQTVIAELARMIGIKPDLTLILDLDPEVAAQRFAARGVAPGAAAPDRYERFGRGFTARVAAGFRAIAAAEPSRCMLIDASGPADAVAARIDAALRDRLGL